LNEPMLLSSCFNVLRNDGVELNNCRRKFILR
jgi:hypothetical protein